MKNASLSVSIGGIILLVVCAYGLYILFYAFIAWAVLYVIFLVYVAISEEYYKQKERQYQEYLRRQDDKEMEDFQKEIDDILNK